MSHPLLTAAFTYTIRHADIGKWARLISTPYRVGYKVRDLKVYYFLLQGANSLCRHGNEPLVMRKSSFNHGVKSPGTAFF